MRRDLGGDQSAVSPVIGTILMVAITVVLAAVVFFMVSQLKDDSSSKHVPEFSAMQDDTHHLLRVVIAEPGLDWVRDMRISGTCTPTLNGGPFPTVVGTAVVPGDTLDCAAGQQLLISSSPDQGDTLLQRAVFR